MSCHECLLFLTFVLVVVDLIERDIGFIKVRGETIIFSFSSPVKLNHAVSELRAIIQRIVVQSDSGIT